MSRGRAYRLTREEMTMTIPALVAKDFKPDGLNHVTSVPADA